MSEPRFNGATHMSIVWGVTLAILTLLEWNSLDRDPMRKRVQVCRREDNANGALSKQRAQFAVAAPRRFFDLYSAYLLSEISDLDSDYVFVNLSRPPVGGPLSYSLTSPP